MVNEVLLDEVIAKRLEDLKDGEPVGDEAKEKIDYVTKLLDRSIEMKKCQTEADTKADDREYDKKLRLQQMADDREDRMIKNGIAIGTFLIGVGVTVWGSLKSWKFEEFGTITSQPGREYTKGLLNLFKRT